MSKENNSELTTVTVKYGCCSLLAYYRNKIFISLLHTPYHSAQHITGSKKSAVKTRISSSSVHSGGEEALSETIIQISISIHSKQLQLTVNINSINSKYAQRDLGSKFCEGRVIIILKLCQCQLISCQLTHVSSS